MIYIYIALLFLILFIIILLRFINKSKDPFGDLNIHKKD